MGDTGYLKVYIGHERGNLCESFVANAFQNQYIYGHLAPSFHSKKIICLRISDGNFITFAKIGCGFFNELAFFKRCFMTNLLFHSILVSQDHSNMKIFSFKTTAEPIPDIRALLPLHMGSAFLPC